MGRTCRARAAPPTPDVTASKCRPPRTPDAHAPSSPLLPVGGSWVVGLHPPPRADPVTRPARAPPPGPLTATSGCVSTARLTFRRPHSQRDAFALLYVTSVKSSTLARCGLEADHDRGHQCFDSVQRTGLKAMLLATMDGHLDDNFRMLGALSVCLFAIHAKTTAQIECGFHRKDSSYTAGRGARGAARAGARVTRKDAASLSRLCTRPETLKCITIPAD
ncbi:hypothetical protein EVAR_30497_1 [Eumeta japonica]|uniref:Uncharacterized protein n=1 Tax=Eumeta variegata TaxID=151549 RepID=A0A4C1VXZ7_EUMVA|nr:hypothetical protein EVAR_30497_1 [Eumeta japonica]